MKNLKKWVIFNILFIIIVGSLSHFIYGGSDSNKIIGIFVAVNESTWEHMKLLMFPMLILMVVEYPFLKSNKNIFVGYFLSLLISVVLIPLLFYGYTFILGDNFLILDISIFIISVIIGQLVFYKIMKMKKISKLCSKMSIVGIILILLSYFIFTYYPLEIFLFKDPITNNYGIVN
ncbi:MAG TPA: DUF6512 family protein [Bacilli bacterium]|nr:DUF6512 family protein [Bacilli bacterium]